MAPPTPRHPHTAPARTRQQPGARADKKAKKKYNMILEEIGAREGLSSVDEVKKLLRDEAEVSWL